MGGVAAVGAVAGATPWARQRVAANKAVYERRMAIPLYIGARTRSPTDSQLMDLLDVGIDPALATPVSNESKRTAFSLRDADAQDR
jgi:hypothetical protein